MPFGFSEIGGGSLKKYIKPFLPLVLAACFLLALSSCGGEDGEIKNGIEITDKAPTYSENTEKRAKDAIYSLLEYYTKKTSGVEAVPPKLEKTLSTHAEKIYGVTRLSPISEVEYVRILEIIEENASGAIDGILSEEKNYDPALKLYADISDIATADYAGVTAYHVLVYSYDFRYEEKMRDYEESGFGFLKEEADVLYSEREALVGIGAERFSDAVKALNFASALFFEGAHEENGLDGFSDEELLILIQNASFAIDGISSDGWGLLLSYAPANETGSYISRLFAAAKKNGDVSAIAENMNAAVTLISDFKASLGVDDMKLVRDRDGAKLLEALLLSLDDEGWEWLEELSSIELRDGDYTNSAKEYFGEDFDRYLETLDVKTAAELRGSLGTDGFLKTLEGYIAGISPALSYLLNDQG